MVLTIFFFCGGRTLLRLRAALAYPYIVNSFNCISIYVVHIVYIQMNESKQYQEQVYQAYNVSRAGLSSIESRSE